MREGFLRPFGPSLLCCILMGCQATESVANLQSTPASNPAQFSIPEGAPGSGKSKATPSATWIDARKVGPGVTEPGTRINIGPPNTYDWDSVRTDTRAWRFTCRPFKCAEQSAVYVTAETNFSGRPDKSYLEKYLKEKIPKDIRDQNSRSLIESNGQVGYALLSSRISQIKGFPAIVVEARKSSGGSSDSIIRSYIFATYAVIRVDSISLQATVARLYSDAVLSGLEIMDKPAAEGHAKVVSGPHLVVLDGAAGSMPVFSANSIPPADRNVQPRATIRAGQSTRPLNPSDPMSRR